MVKANPVLALVLATMVALYFGVCVVIGESIFQMISEFIWTDFFPPSMMVSPSDRRKWLDPGDSPNRSLNIILALMPCYTYIYNNPGGILAYSTSLMLVAVTLLGVVDYGFIMAIVGLYFVFYASDRTGFVIKLLQLLFFNLLRFAYDHVVVDLVETGKLIVTIHLAQYDFRFAFLLFLIRQFGPGWMRTLALLAQFAASFHDPINIVFLFTLEWQALIGFVANWPPKIREYDWVLQSGSMYLKHLGLPNSEALSLVEDLLIMLTGLISIAYTATSRKKATYKDKLCMCGSASMHIMAFLKAWAASDSYNMEEVTSSIAKEFTFADLATRLAEIERVTQNTKADTNNGVTREFSDDRLHVYTDDDSVGSDGGGDDDYKVQSGGDFMSNMAGILARADALIKGRFGQSLVKVVVAVMALVIYVRGSDVHFSMHKYMQMREGFVTGSINGAVDMLREILRAIQFLTTNGVDFLKTGSWSSLFSDPHCLTTWMYDLGEFKLQVENFTIMREVDGGKSMRELDTDAANLTARIAAIEEAAKFKSLGKANSTITSMKSDLNKTLAAYNMKKAARSTRPCPFPLLLHGSPNVGKSIFSEIVKRTMASVFNFSLEDPDVTYVYSGSTSYMDGLTSKCRIFVIDDIAQYKPQAINGVDPQLAWLIPIVNNVAFTPNMADLTEKGKIAFCPDVVLATSNTVTLNARNYFTSEFAARRRLKNVVTLYVKTEFATPDTQSFSPERRVLDKEKIRPVPGGYHDLWEIVIQEVVARENGDCALKEVAKFDNVYEAVSFLAILAGKWRSHESFVEDNIKEVQTLSVCDSCHLPLVACRCSEFVSQAGVEPGGDGTSPVSYWCALMTLVIAILSLGFYACRWTYNATVNLVRSLARRGQIPWWLAIGLHYLRFLSTMDMAHYVGIRLQSRRNAFVKALAATAAIGGSLYVFFRLLNSLVLQGGAVSSEDVPPDGRPNIYNRPWRVHNLSTMEKTHAGVNGNANFTNRVSKHVYALKVQNGEDKWTRVMALKVHSSVFISVGHAFRDKGLGTIRVKWETSTQSGEVCAFDLSKIYYDSESDLCAFCLPTTPLGADLTPCFIDQATSIAGEGFYLSVDTLGANPDGIMVRRANVVNHIEKEACPSAMRALLPSLDTGVIRCDLRGEVPTASGDCGSPLILLRGGNSFPSIAGVHCIGSERDKTKAFSIPVTSSKVLCLIERAKAQLNDYRAQSGLQEFSLLPRGDIDISPFSVSGQTHPKDPTNWLGDQTELPPITPLGSILDPGGRPSFRAHRKSEVVDSLAREFMESKGFTCEKGPPVLTGYRPARNNLCGMSSTGHLSASKLSAATQGYYDDILLGIEDKKIVLGKICDIDNVNGNPRNRFLNSLNFSSSAGFPHNVSKDKFFPVSHFDEERQAPVRTIDPQIEAEMDAITSRYLAGSSANPPFSASLKDEPTSRKKIEEANTRVIYGVPLAFGLLVRRYFLLFVVLFQSNPYVFEGAPGINACSPEWTELFNHVTSHGEDRIVAGDYKGWDKSVLSADIMKCAFDIILSICWRFGTYDSDDRLVMRGIATDICYGTCNYFGTMIQFFGTNMSGHNLTVIVNCMVNSILLRYAYISLSPAVTSHIVNIEATRVLERTVANFKRHVSLITYGDDNQMGVSEEAPWFNHSALSTLFSSIGITYTDAQKSGRQFDYENASTTSFLKRGYRREATEQDGFIRAPLDKDSIIRSLMVWRRSPTESPRFQLASVIRSAHRESYQHGREFFATMDGLLGDMITHFNLDQLFEDSPLPSWEGYTADMYGVGA
jgi:hypothetical protein